jgi:hypothetical protein
VNPDLGLKGQTSTGQPGGTPTPVTSAEQGGFSMMDLAAGYALQMPKGSFIHSVKIKLQLDNALNRKILVLNGVGATPAANTYNVLPTTSYFLTISTEF